MIDGIQNCISRVAVIMTLEKWHQCRLALYYYYCVYCDQEKGRNNIHERQSLKIIIAMVVQLPECVLLSTEDGWIWPKQCLAHTHTP